MNHPLRAKAYVRVVFSFLKILGAHTESFNMQHQVTSMQHQSSDTGLQSFHQMWQESCGWHVRSLSKREYKLYKMLQGYHVDNVSLTAEVDKLNGDFSDMLKGYNDLYEEKGQLESQCYKFRHQICELSERAETSDVGVQIKPQISVRGSQTSSHKTDSSTQSSQSPEVTSHSTQASAITISKSSQTSTANIGHTTSATQTPSIASNCSGISVSTISIPPDNKLQQDSATVHQNQPSQSSSLDPSAKTYQPPHAREKKTYTPYSQTRSTRGNYGFSHHCYTGRASRDHNWRKTDTGYNEGCRSQWQIPRFIPPDLFQLCCVIRQIVTCMY